MKIDRRIQRGVEYYCVDAIAFLVNIGCAWALAEYGIPYLLATAAGFAIQTAGAFFVNRVWTFGGHRVRVSRGLLATTVVQSSVFAIVFFGTAYGVEIWSLSFLASRILSGLVAGAWGYVADSYVTFRVSPIR
jgi:putative flippase GtrA